MPDWIPGILAAAPALAGVGALFWRVGRLEEDVRERATKESQLHLAERLTKIEALLERINDRLSRRGNNTNSGDIE